MDKSIATYDALRTLSFVEDASVNSDDPGGLSFDFGNFKLYASHCMNPLFANIVLLSGVMSTPRTIAEVRCEMPQRLESVEQAAAWVACCLDSHADAQFKPAVPVSWLDSARQSRHLLPWERQKAAHAARPHCVASRSWARIAFRELAAALSRVDDDTPVDFNFDGAILAIHCGQTVVPLPASGEAWKNQYRLSAGRLRRLPKRLLHETVHWSVWDSTLSIGNRSYRGVIALDAKS